MGQDMQKGRSTGIEFLNGFVVRDGEKVGLPCRANAVLTDLVRRVERDELKPDPRHITELLLNRSSKHAAGHREHRSFAKGKITIIVPAEDS